MTKEEVRKELNEATKLQKEATRKVNEALCHAAGQLDKAGSESFETGHKIGYDKGLKDCWEMVKKIYNKTDYAYRDAVFGDRGDVWYLSSILETFTPQQALAKIRAWEGKKAEEERKKQEEAEKIQIGDVVEATVGCPVRQQLKGIFLMETDTTYNILDPTGNVYICMKDNNPIIKKTGEHIDILGPFGREIKEK